MDEPGRERILILAPTGRDGELTARVLERHGLDCVECPDGEALVAEIERDAGAVVLGQEALDEPFRDALSEVLEKEPLWSDLPFVVLTRGGPPFDLFGSLELEINATLLERPIHVTNLVSAVRAALRARRRQYEVRDLLERLALEDRRKDEFLAMLGHELRNPLAAIGTAVTLLGRSEVGPEETRRYRSIAAEQVEHLKRVVDDLLDLTRISAGEVELRRERIELGELLARVVETLELTVGAGRVEVVRPARPVEVSADPVRLEQVVTNLVEGALDYAASDGRVHLAATEEEGEAVLRVRDGGTERAATLSGASDVAGFGLGLDLARRLIERHGGSVEAASAGRGRGAEFTVRLPLAAADPVSDDTEIRVVAEGEAGAGGRAPATAGGEAPRVLLVEDNEGGREALGALLRIWGYEVDDVETGGEALEHAFEAPPAVALIDIDLPDLSGYEVARRMCRHFNGSRPYLIAITGFGQPEDRRRALEAGFDQHLVKPVAPPELDRILAAAIGAGD